MTDTMLTHKGWFGVCPVYLTDDGRDGVVLVERHWLFRPLMWLTVHVYGLLIFLATMVNSDYEPEWPVMITGEIKPMKAPAAQGGE